MCNCEDMADARPRRKNNEANVVNMMVNYVLATLLDPKPGRHFGP